jgi:MoxR-like ATPase
MYLYNMDDVLLLSRLHDTVKKIKKELSKTIVGQEQIIDQLLTCLLANGHCIIIGVPGLAKTLLVSTLAKIIDLDFKRIQFTPDLMPSDITGREILEEDKTTGARMFRFVQGPVFANIVLADEINRTPPKTQSALLQAMQEYEVTFGGKTHPLPKPFFVLATQNPIEHEGTYPLPEAQLDRFMFLLKIEYPARDEEYQIVKHTTTDAYPQIDKIINIQDILSFQNLVRKLPVTETLIQTSVDLVRKTRPEDSSSSEFIKKNLSWGAGPRASQFLILGAKARAALQGQPAPSMDDIKAVAPHVLRHRIILNFSAQADGIKADDIIQELLK